MQEPIVLGVERLIVRVPSPEPLFSILTQHLVLPRAWPPTTGPFFTSAGVFLGNMNLELLQVSPLEQPAHLYGISFDLQPDEISLPELAERGILHTPPMPYYMVDDQAWQVTAWTNIYLGGLIGSSQASRLFFTLSQRAPKETWESGSLPRPVNRRLALPFIYNQVYKRGMTLATRYNPSWHAAHITQQPDHNGLDVKQVYEVTVGARDIDRAHDCWKALLDPHPEIAPGIWQLPGGMHLRLVKSAQDGLRRMIWQVASLNRAAQFLNRRQMLGKEKNGMLTIASSAVEGLDIRLVQ